MYTATLVSAVYNDDQTTVVLTFSFDCGDGNPITLVENSNDPLNGYKELAEQKLNELNEPYVVKTRMDTFLASVPTGVISFS